METIEGTQEAVDHVLSVQFIEVGNQAQAPAPLIRITSCGLLSIEVVEEIVSTDPPLARYIPLTLEQLRGRGTAPALTLLKLLLSCPERFALKDWLTEQFCRDQELFSSVRMDNIVSFLRGLLCPSQYADLRTNLIAYVRNGLGNGGGYQLALYPLIWVDHEALAWQVEQAVRMERFADDPFPYWERAYALARRGPYLPDEMYADWSTTRRSEIAGMLRQSVQALARLLRKRNGLAGEEEALLILRNYWLENPREEDILRPLMELLGRRECYHEALDSYAQLQTLLKQEGHQPDVQTRDLAAYLREKQIRRSDRRLNTATDRSQLQSTQFSIFQIERTDIFQQSARQKVPDVADAPFVLPLTLSSAEVLERLARVLMKPTQIDEGTLLLLEQRVRECWQFRPDILGMISPDLVHILLQHLQQVTTLLNGSLIPFTRVRLCSLACELTQIIGWTLYETRAFAQAQAYYEMALLSAREAGNPLLEAVTLARMSRVFKYCAQEEAILPALQHARHLLAQRNASPTFSWLCAEEALAYARNGQAYESLKMLEQATFVGEPNTPEEDPYWIGYEANVRAGFFGSCYTTLQQFDQAKIFYKEALTQITPSSRINPRHRRSLLLVNLATILLQEEAIGEACQLSKEAVMLVSQSRSPLVLQHLVKFKQKLGPWQALAEVEPFHIAFEQVHQAVLQGQNN